MTWISLILAGRGQQRAKTMALSIMPSRNMTESSATTLACTLGGAMSVASQARCLHHVHPGAHQQEGHGRRAQAEAHIGPVVSPESRISEKGIINEAAELEDGAEQDIGHPTPAERGSVIVRPEADQGAQREDQRQRATITATTATPERKAPRS